MKLKRLTSSIKGLELWHESPIRSPLLLIGPRQVGKTTLLNEFAHIKSKNVLKINFWADQKNEIKQIFIKGGSAGQLLKYLAEFFLVEKIDTRNDILLIDEIQECPEAYSSLKLFKEDYPEFRILVTGSYLQLFLKNESLKKLPVGCVDTFYLRPLTFEEFLLNANSVLYKKWKEIDLNRPDISGTLHEMCSNYLRDYFFTGGLPEVVKLFLASENTHQSRNQVRQKQQELLTDYTLDFQKYSKSIYIKKIDQLFKQIPLQLEQVREETSNRFQFKDLEKKATYKDFHWPFEYLSNAGLIIKSHLISKVSRPFRLQEKKEDRNLFKCFYFDIGLLNAALNTSYKEIQNLDGAYKGYLAENFVAQSIRAKIATPDLFSYLKSSRVGSAEIEFVIPDLDQNPVPIEVKSSSKAHKSKSLDSFIKDFAPENAYKLVPTQGDHFSKEDKNQKNYKTLPLYLIDLILENLS